MRLSIYHLLKLGLYGMMANQAKNTACFDVLKQFRLARPE